MIMETVEIPAKAIKKLRKPTLKQRLFAEEYVKNNGNASQAAIKVYRDMKTENIARSMGSENLTKPVIRAEIHRLLEQNGVVIDDIVKTHRRNMLQNKHLPTSQNAVRDFYDILGVRKSVEDKSSVQIALIIEK